MLISLATQRLAMRTYEWHQKTLSILIISIVTSAMLPSTTRTRVSMKKERSLTLQYDFIKYSRLKNHAEVIHVSYRSSVNMKHFY